MGQDFAFAHPQFFWLLLSLPLLLVWLYFNRKRETSVLRLSSLKGFKARDFLSKIRPFLSILRLITLALIITALARPQNEDISSRTKTTKGIDIVIAIDVSSSMLARDLKPNRLAALKEVAGDFIDKRPSDRIGLVAYAGESYTKTPITSDKSIVKRALKEIKYGQLEDGTAIGMGTGDLSQSLKRQQSPEQGDHFADGRSQ